MQNVLLCFSWGHQYPRPGLSNEVMAREIIKIKDKYSFILTQREISDALKNFGLKPDYIIGNSGVYLNSYEVAKDMKDWLAKNTTKDVGLYVLCHNTHWSGLQLVFKKLKMKAKRVEVIIPYDPSSHQWYTRGPVRALIGKLFHVFSYFLRGEI